MADMDELLAALDESDGEVEEDKEEECVEVPAPALEVPPSVLLLDKAHKDMEKQKKQNEHLERELKRKVKQLKEISLQTASKVKEKPKAKTPEKYNDAGKDLVICELTRQCEGKVQILC